MYSCPNCAAALRFSIKSQDLFCDHCDSHFSPYDFDKEQDAEFHESGMYETQIFTCPSCGAEISSTDSQAAGFCSYCGSPTILSMRIQKEQAPTSIIPFSVSKEECIKAYKKFVKKGIFAPSKMLKESHLEDFRGIYMPYWNFNLSQNNLIHLETNRSYRVGDYIKHEVYGISARLEARYSGITFDSSSSFSDAISERIAPFDIHHAKRFTPSYLLGFYADIADVPYSYYSDQAEAEAKADLYDFLIKDAQLGAVPGTLDRSKINSQLTPIVSKVDTVMFPVWFLSYRYKDRIAYATVNGQTGKIAGDIPVSTGKFLLFSGAIAVILFLFLNIFFTFKPVNLLYAVIVISVITMILYHRELKQICRQDLFQDDVGYLYKTRGMKEEAEDEVIRKAISAQEKSHEGGHSVSDISSRAIVWIQKHRSIFSVAVSALFFFVYLFGFRALFSFGKMSVSIASAFSRFATLFHVGSIVPYVVLVVVAILWFLLSFQQWRMQSSIFKGPHIPGALLSGSGLLTAFLTLIIDPVNDWWYYGATLAAVLLVFFSLLQLTRYYNFLATRKLPQYYMYEGGDYNETGVDSAEISSFDEMNGGSFSGMNNNGFNSTNDDSFSDFKDKDEDLFKGD
ncbi:MAG: zinc ribbon domain-containing protein [Lachnospiraceae bacterium]|nr:zinc ribbon domain-containing protein [Lachnospiraceae bacterium]